MLKQLKQILADAFSLSQYFSLNDSCFVAEAAQERWEENMQNCKYEGSYCEYCKGLNDCAESGKACKGGDV